MQLTVVVLSTRPLEEGSNLMSHAKPASKTYNMVQPAHSLLYGLTYIVPCIRVSVGITIMLFAGLSQLQWTPLETFLWIWPLAVLSIGHPHPWKSMVSVRSVEHRVCVRRDSLKAGSSSKGHVIMWLGNSCLVGCYSEVLLSVMYFWLRVKC